MARTKQRARKRIRPASRNVLKRKRAPKDSQGDSSSTFEGFSPPPPFKQRGYSEDQAREIEDRVTKKKKKKLGDKVEDEGDDDEDEDEHDHDDDDEDEKEDDDDDDDEEEAEEEEPSKRIDDKLRAEGLTRKERKKVKVALAQAEATAEAQATMVTKIYQKSTQVATDNVSKEDTVNGTNEDRVGLNTEMRSEEHSLTQPLSKKVKKRPEKQKKKGVSQVLNDEETSLKQKLEDEENVDDSIAQMDSSLLADHYA